MAEYIEYIPLSCKGTPCSVLLFPLLRNKLPNLNFQPPPGVFSLPGVLPNVGGKLGVTGDVGLMLCELTRPRFAEEK